MKIAERKFQEIIRPNLGEAAQIFRSKSYIAQQAPSNHSQKSESSDASSDVVEGDETGEEIEKERNLDCDEDDEFLTEQSDEDETGSTTMDVLGSTTLLASNSVEEARKGIVVAEFWLYNTISISVLYTTHIII